MCSQFVWRESVIFDSNLSLQIIQQVPYIYNLFVYFSFY